MRRLLSAIRQFGFDPLLTIKAARRIPKYCSDLLKFIAQGKFDRITLAPTLQDFGSKSSNADGHYFWQDLICAKWIYESQAKSHFDVGSRVDGFIAHLLTFREVIQLDIRLPHSSIPNLQTVIGDAQNELLEFSQKFDSVSCLHSLEHFGLGRYGDNLDPSGHIKGLLNISQTVVPGGLLYVSFPIGREQVQFNEQRIIHPMFPITNLVDFNLEEFVLIPWKGAPILGTSPLDVELGVKGQAGLYRFRKI